MLQVFNRRGALEKGSQPHRQRHLKRRIPHAKVVTISTAWGRKTLAPYDDISAGAGTPGSRCLPPYAAEFRPEALPQCSIERPFQPYKKFNTVMSREDKKHARSTVPLPGRHQLPPTAPV
ncbi:MAG: hypothetical protein PW843_30420 [Azospirillaceae bacterium]|nr:hypothetical protein [Azospirillaceae bacterium]